tara:strand:- start:221 stop:1387 length:1167 start_codon:yes stop_codon:yes gene_type:complete
MTKPFYRCSSCLLPNTKPDLHFEGDTCLACKFQRHQDHTVDWDARRKEFDELLGSLKRSDSEYDCLVAVSGGKDSVYQAYLTTQVAGLKPLLVSFEPSYPTEVGRQNLSVMTDAFNADLLQLKKSSTYRKLARAGFDLVGDHEWPNHVGIFCWPVQMAVKLRIPTIFYGEPGGYIGLGRWEKIESEKTVTREHIEQYVGMNGLRLSDILDIDPTISKKDVIPYVYPSEEELGQHEITAYNLGHFFHWDTQRNIRLIKKFGWQTAPERTEMDFGNWESIDCGFMPMHQYFKFIKYGYSRATDHASYELRHGRLSKRQAIEYIMEYDWPLPTRYFEEFLEFLSIDEDYFFKTVDRFANPLLFEVDNKNDFVRAWDNNLVLKDIWFESLKA